MATTNAQWGAVRPGGLRKKPRYLEQIRAQYGQPTQQVMATKERQQQQEETAFNQSQAKKNYKLDVQRAKEEKKHYERQKKLGYASTGLDLVSTIVGFFS